MGIKGTVLPAAVGLLLSSAAYAQDAATDAVVAPETIPVEVAQPEPAPEQKDRVRAANRLIEEVVVTAQKREERLQDVPISIQAFSGDALAARGIENTEQLGQTVPSLQFTNVAGFTLIFLRGIGTDQFIPSADPSVATYIDGIYIPAGHTVAQSLGNVERVEVLKGPQGTLFGRNSTGGAISIVTAEPGNLYEASAETEFANFDSRSAKVSMSGPVTDWFSAGIDGLLARGDNYYTNINYEVVPDKLDALRLKLLFHPTDDLSLSLTGYRSNQSGLGSVLTKNTDPSLLGQALLIQPQEDDFSSETDFRSEVRGSQRIYYGNLTWKLPAFDLKLLGSDQYILTDFASIDFDGSPVPIAAFDAANEYTDLNTAELQILSNADSWAADKFQWVAGLFYYRSTAGFDPAHIRVAPQAFTSFQDLFGAQFPQGINDLIAALPADYTPLGEQGLQLEFGGLLGTRSYSGYAQGTYFITDGFDLTLGGRYQREERFLTKSQTSAVDPTTGEFTVPIFNFELKEATATNFSPKAVLSLHPRENALLYTSYSVGFKSGTYNVVNIYQPPEYIVPEKVTTYEAGAKVDFFGGLLRLNGAIFYNDIENLQSGFVSLLGGGVVRFQTAKGARTRGAEIDGTLVPMPDLNPGLALTGNAAYVDAIYTDFKDGSGFQEGTGIYSDNIDFSGNRTVRTPKWSGGIGIVQTLEGEQGTYEIAIDDYYNSGFFYDAFNNVEEKPYSILNLRAGYLHDPWKLRVTLFVKNLLDERYHVQQFQTDFGIAKTLAPPRQYGLRLNWEF